MTTIGRPRAAALLISGSLLLCGSPRPAPAATKGSAKASVRSAGATPPARAAVLPVVPPTDPTVFASAGPYLAGVTTLAIATFGPSKTKTAEVWYPVQPLNSRRITTETLYDLRQMLPRSQSRLLGKQIGAVQKTEAARGARITPGGPFPVVVFSHGFGGFATQSAFLMTHLATWGFVVIAPDHPSRDIAAVLSGKFSFNERDDVDDLRASVAALGGSAFRQSIDLNNLAALGHSAGADAVVRWSAGEPRVQGLIVMAGGVSGMSGKLPEPMRPILYMSADNDQIISAQSIASAYHASQSPKRLIALKDSGHLAFADICVIGADGGGMLADAERLGVKVPAVLRALGTDGCGAPNAPVTKAWPVIRSSVVAELRAIFGSGTPGFGLDQATLDTLAARGSVESTFTIS